jgi:hypothetical protein
MVVGLLIESFDCAQITTDKKKNKKINIGFKIDKNNYKGNKKDVSSRDEALLVRVKTIIV